MKKHDDGSVTLTAKEVHELCAITYGLDAWAMSEEAQAQSDGLQIKIYKLFGPYVLDKINTVDELLAAPQGTVLTKDGGTFTYNHNEGHGPEWEDQDGDYYQWDEVPLPATVTRWGDEEA